MTRPASMLTDGAHFDAAHAYRTIETYIPTAAKLAPTENEKLNAYRVGDVDFRITAKRRTIRSRNGAR